MRKANNVSSTGNAMRLQDLYRDALQRDDLDAPPHRGSPVVRGGQFQEICRSIAKTGRSGSFQDGCMPDHGVATNDAVGRRLRNLHGRQTF